MIGAHDSTRGLQHLRVLCVHTREMGSATLTLVIHAQEETKTRKGFQLHATPRHG